MTLLDTHALIWWVSGSAELSEKAQKAIDRAVKKGTLHVSSMSIWEIAMLVRKGRLVLSMEINEWLGNIEALDILRFIPVDNAIALHSVNLPGDFHSDPADRIIAATARLLNLTLVTKDASMREYPYLKTLW